MLKIKAPLQTVLKADFIHTGEGFCQRILGNYAQITESIVSEDLMHVVTQPPEVFLLGGGGSSLVSETEVRNQQIQKVHVINNVLNRILIAADGKLTYQDSTYISASLHKLGIHNDKRFMEQVFKLTRETKETNQLIHAYQDNREQLLSLLAQYRSDRHEESTSTYQDVHNEILHLHEEVNRRWMAGDVYRTQQQFAISSESGTVITGEAYQLAEAGMLERAMVLQQLREEIRGEAVPLVYYHDNIYEAEHFSESVQSEERLREQVTSAVLLSMVDNIYRSAYEQIDHREDNWYQVDSALYRAGDNTLMRMVHNTAYLSYLHEQQLRREETHQQLTNELSLISQMISQSPQAIELYYRQEGDIYEEGDTYRAGTAGARTELYQTTREGDRTEITRRREGDTFIQQRTLTEGDVTNVDATTRNLIEQYRQEDIHQTEIGGDRTEVHRITREGDQTQLVQLREGDEETILVHPAEGDISNVDAATRNLIEQYRQEDTYRTEIEGDRTEIYRSTREGDQTHIRQLREGDEKTVLVHPAEGDITNVDASTRNLIEQYRQGDTHRTEIGGERTEVYRTTREGDVTYIRQLREGDEETVLVHPREGDVTNIEGDETRILEEYRTRQTSLTQQQEQTTRVLQQYIDNAVSIQAPGAGEAQPGEAPGGRGSGMPQAAAGTGMGRGPGVEPGSTPAEEAGEAPPLVHPQEGEEQAGSVVVDERNTIEQQLYQINRQNILRQNQYLNNLANLVKDYHEQTPQSTPQERLREDMLMALEHPEQMAAELRREEERGRRFRDAVVEETYRMMPPEQRRVYELVERYLEAPQAFVDHPVVSPGGESLLYADILGAGREIEVSRELPQDTVISLTEARERVIEEITRAPAEVHRREAPVPESVFLTHRQTENTIDEETIQQLRQELRRVEEQTTRVTETVEATRQEERREIYNENREVITETNMEKLTSLVSTSVRGQLDEISERIYGRLERQLHNERRRRGL